MKYVGSWILMAAFSLSFSTLFAQEEKQEEEKPESTVIVEDTLQVGQSTFGVNEPGVDVADTIVIETLADQHSPRKAALFSAVLPGLGQVYNRKYWKIPIIYGGFLTMGYFITLYDDQYNLFLQALNAERNGEVNPLEGIAGGIYEDAGRLQRQVDNARRQRDFMIILTTGVYALNIVDAIVDAHLIEFDINPELSFDMKPVAGSALAYYDHLTPTVPTYGFSFTVSLY
ncbi:MAG: DUF5683 domain-containing protein [Cyclobacteriaceae bacterium]